jgi:hypothetical protein
VTCAILEVLLRASRSSFGSVAPSIIITLR